MSTQALPHLTKPVLQTKPQPPALQVAVPLAGAVQALPQLPQLFGSVAVAMQALPHFVYPLSQAKPQAPDAQVGLPFAGSGQTLPQAPQLLTLLPVFTQAPPHSASGEVQPDAHTPPLQTMPVSHTVPQVPQLNGSLFTSTQPSGSQLVKPLSQVRPHFPALQARAPFVTAGH